MKMSSRISGGILALAAAGSIFAAVRGERQALDDPAWRYAVEDYSWSFPRDHWAHSGYRTEWWYLTGHLRLPGEEEPCFGYQFTFFKVGLAPEVPELDSRWTTDALIMGHAAISDLREEKHVFSDVLHRAVPLLGGFGEPPDRRLAWCLASPGTDGEWELSWNGAGFDCSMIDAEQGLAFALSTNPVKPRIFQGPNGFSRKGAGPRSASLYYSFPRLATEGWVELDGVRHEVVGESWMDKEFSSSPLDKHQSGWDWFSLQLDDGRELMLFHLRGAEGEVDAGKGTLVLEDGAVRYLDREAFGIEVLERWRSEATDAEYPAAWIVTVPELELTLRVEPSFADQENVGRRLGGVYYWEGSVRALDPSGKRRGQGYVELTGYGPENRLPLSREGE